MAIINEGTGGTPILQYPLPIGPGLNEVYSFLQQKGFSTQDIQSLINSNTLNPLANALGYGGIGGGGLGGGQPASGLNLYEGNNADLDKALQKLFGGLGGGGGSRFDFGALRESLTGQLRAGGWAVPFDVTGIVRAVAGRKGDFSMLINRIISDRRFKKSFPGIFNKDGTLKMSPAEYRDKVQSYQALAATYRFKLNAKQLGQMISGDVSANEAQFRFQIGATIRDNQAVFLDFGRQLSTLNSTLKSAGKPSLGTLGSIKDIASFIARTAPRELYAVYEASSISAAAKEAGISVGEARARQLAAAGAGIVGFEDAQKSFKVIAESLRSAGVELSFFGITQAELETIEFGGSKRQELALKAEQALKQRQAAIQGDISAEPLKLQGGKPVSETQAPAGA